MTTFSTRTVRFTAFLMVLIAPQLLVSQEIRPAGVVSQRHAERATTLPPRVDLSQAVAADSSNGHPWVRVGAGALLGGVAGGVVAGVAVSRSDDPILAGPGIMMVTVLGAVVGGLVGGLAWLVSH